VSPISAKPIEARFDGGDLSSDIGAAVTKDDHIQNGSGGARRGSNGSEQQGTGCGTV